MLFFKVRNATHLYINLFFFLHVESFHPTLHITEVFAKFYRNKWDPEISKTAKIHKQNLKKSFSPEPLGEFQLNYNWRKSSSGNGDSIVTNKRPFHF